MLIHITDPNVSFAVPISSVQQIWHNDMESRTCIVTTMFTYEFKQSLEDYQQFILELTMGKLNSGELLDCIITKDIIVTRTVHQQRDVSCPTSEYHKMPDINSTHNNYDQNVSCVFQIPADLQEQLMQNMQNPVAGTETHPFL